MKTTNQIFDYISGMNPTTSTISSMGSFVSNMNQQVADTLINEVLNSLPTDSLAYKIVVDSNRFSNSQLAIIASELEKNKEFVSRVEKFYNEINRKEAAKAEASKAKKAANKEASADVLAPIKEMRKLGDFGKWLNTYGNPFRKQHFNKKYTVEAVNEFLQTL